MRPNTPETFWANVAIGKPLDCWPWQAGQSASYGAYQWRGKTRPAHRVAYELAYGPIAEGLDIDHRCRNRLCVNPHHLEAVTHSENMRRRRGYGQRP